MNSFAVCYIESNIACVLVFGVLLIHNHFNPDREASMKLRAARGDRIKAIPNPLQKGNRYASYQLRQLFARG